MLEKLSKQGLKRCIMCKDIIPLDLEHFYRNSSRSDGFDTRCKKCNTIRSRTRRANGLDRKIKDSFIEGYIYLFECMGYYKIGCTRYNDMDKRILGMQEGNPFTIAPKKIYKNKLLKDMYMCEKQLHYKFHNKRVRGEWFSLNKNDLIYIENYFS